MVESILEFAVGLLTAGIAFRDLVQTVVVPGGARNSLRVSRRLVFLALPLRARLFRREIGVSFAPVILLASFMVWMALLMIGFALMAYAVRHRFTPPLEDFGDALFVAGSAMTTVGTGNANPVGLAACVTVAAGVAGLASMTMAVTYVLEVQASIHERDRGVLKLSAASGEPPSALVMLEQYAALGCRAELAGILRNGRDWCAAVLQSHASHPWLIYFRTPGVGSAWPTSLGVVMDLGLLFELLLADDPRLSGLGALVRQQAQSLSTQLVDLLSLDIDRSEGLHNEADLDALRRRLEDAGYALRPDADLHRFAATRARYAAPIEALCRHLGAHGAPLVGPMTRPSEA